MIKYALSVVVCCVFVSCTGRTASDYLARGNAAAEAGSYEAASIHYRNAIQKDPGLAEAHYGLGLASWELGKMAEAEGALRQAVMLAPGYMEANVKLADLYISAYVSKPGSRQYISEQLEIISERLLDKDPNSYDGRRIRGYLAMANRRPDEAVEFFRRAGAAGSAAPEIVIALAQSLVQAGQFAEAEKLSLDLIRRNEDFAPAYDSMYVQYLAAKRVRDAEAVLRRKVSQFPDVAAYVLQLAEFLHRNGSSPDELEQTLRVLTTDQRRFPKGPLQVADFYESRGRADKAIAALEESMPEDSEERYQYRQRLVSLHLKQGNAAAARTAIEELAKEARGDAEVLAMRAFLRLELGEPDEITAAVRELSELVRKVPDNAQFQLFLGHAFRARGDFDAARDQYLEAATKRLKWTPPRLALVELSLARRQYLEALRHADEIAAYEPLSPRLRMLRSVAMLGVGHVHNARSELEKLAREFPDNPEPQLELGFIDLVRKRPKEAEERFRKLHQPGQKDLRALAALVEVRLAQSQAGQAIRVLEEELPRSQNPIGVRRLLATTEARAGRTDNAIRHYRRLVAENVASFDVLFALGELHQKKSDHQEALEWLKKAQDMAPRDPRPPIWMGYSYEKLRRLEEAKKSYQLGLSHDPDNPLALNNLAGILSEEGDQDEAFRLAKLALGKAPEHPEFLDTLGGIYLKQKLPDSALQIFQDLVKRYPNESRFRYRLALALIDKGDKRQARLELQTALSGRVSEEMARKIEALLEGIG